MLPGSRRKLPRHPPSRRVEFGVGQREIRYSTPRIIDLLTVWKKGIKCYVVTKKGKSQGEGTEL